MKLNKTGTIQQQFVIDITEEDKDLILKDMDSNKIIKEIIHRYKVSQGLPSHAEFSITGAWKVFEEYGNNSGYFPLRDVTQEELDILSTLATLNSILSIKTNKG